MKVIIISLFVFIFSFTLSANNDTISEKIEAYKNKIKASINDSSTCHIIDSLFYCFNQDTPLETINEANELKYNYHYAQRDTQNMLDAAQACIEFYDENNLINDKLKLWNEVIVYKMSIFKDLIPILDELKEYQDLALQTNNDIGIMNSYFNTGRCYYTWCDYFTAFYHFKKALEFGEKKNLNISYKDYHNAAACARLAGENKYSTAWQKRAFNVYQNRSENKNETLIFIAGLLRNYIADRETYSDALIEATFDSLQVEKNKFPFLRGYHERRYNDAMLAYYMDYKNNPYKSLSYIYDGSSYITSLSKAKLYEALDMYQPAADNYKKAYQSIKEIQERQIGYTLEKYIERYDYDKMKNEKDKLLLTNANIELEKLTIQNQLTKQRTIGLILIFLLITISLIIYYRTHIKKHQLKEILLKQEKEKAEKAEYIKSLFLQNMSHEIRTPLNAIVGFNDLLNGGYTNEIDPTERIDMVNMIKTNVELLQTLVNDVLDISKFESGTYKIDLIDVNVEQLCKTVIESIRCKVAPGVELILKCTPPNFIVRTDAQRLQQVISNFLSNACKYTTDGYIELEYRIIEQSIMISVTDTGIGIQPEEMETIFQRFKMLNKNIKGTGLGLHICQLIAQLLKGNVYVDRSYTQGARFVLEIPIDY